MLLYKGKHQNSLPLTTDFSQNVSEPSKGISYLVGELCQRFTKLTGRSAHTLQCSPILQQMVQMAFCDLLHTGHQCFPTCFCHPTLGNLDVSLNSYLPNNDLMLDIVLIIHRGKNINIPIPPQIDLKDYKYVIGFNVPPSGCCSINNVHKY